MPAQPFSRPCPAQARRLPQGPAQPPMKRALSRDFPLCPPRMAVRDSTGGGRCRNARARYIVHPIFPPEEEARMDRLYRSAMTLVCLTWIGAAQAQHDMSFFVTSTGKGNGADLGGLEGAD